ncbi:MAG: acyltransferase [Candidatus Altiarchaeota archaeon]
MACGRRFDLDWLRVAATFSVVVFHCMVYFDVGSWGSGKAFPAMVFSFFVVFFSGWMMPLFFMVSGAAVFFSLASRGPTGFVLSRVSRLLVPFIGVGLFVMVPVIDYAGFIGSGGSSSFTSYYADFVSGLTLFSGGYPFLALPARHLWYLEYLFAYSLLLLPLFVYLRSGAGRLLVSGMAYVFGSPLMVLLFSLPFGVLTSVLDPGGPFGDVRDGGWPLLSYPLFMFFGFLLVSDGRFESAVSRRAASFFLFGAASFIMGPLVYVSRIADFSFGSWAYVALMFSRSLGSWMLLLGFMGLARRHLSCRNRFLDYLAGASLPVYILHQPVIDVVALFIADRVSYAFPKFLLLLAVSLAAIMVLYEVLVRRLSVLRVLFGMKPAASGRRC